MHNTQSVPRALSTNILYYMTMYMRHYSEDTFTCISMEVPTPKYIPATERPIIIVETKCLICKLVRGGCFVLAVW